MALFGNRFYNRKHEQIDVIISNDPTQPAFQYNTLDGLTYTALNLSDASPVTISQNSDDGLFSPIKSTSATIRVMSSTPLLDLYNPTNKSVSVKIVKNIASLPNNNNNLLGQVVPVLRSELRSDPTAEPTPEPRPYPGDGYHYYDSTIVIEDTQAYHYILYPLDWTELTFNYNPSNYIINSESDVTVSGTTWHCFSIKATISSPGDISVYYQFSQQYYEDNDIQPDETNEPVVWPTYVFPLDIDASAIPASSKSKPYHPGSSFWTDELFIMVNSTQQTIFQGYVTPCEYTQDYNIVDEIELECIDCLSALKNIPFDMDKNQTVKWIDIISTSLQKMGGYTSFFLPNSYDKAVVYNEGQSNEYWISHGMEGLYQQVNNFYDEDEDDTKTWYEVLEAFAKTFSLSIIPYAGFIIFLDYLNAENSYDQYVNGVYRYTYTFEEEGTISEDIEYSGNGGTMSLDTVYNKIVITSETNEIPDVSYDEEIEDKSIILSNCNPNYETDPDVNVYPSDHGYNYWRSFKEAYNKTTNLYKFVYPYNNTKVSVGNVIMWTVDTSTWNYSSAQINPRLMTGNAWTFVDMSSYRNWHTEAHNEYRHIPYQSAPVTIKHYDGGEWCVPIQNCNYDDEVPSTVNWDNMLLLKCLYTGKTYSTIPTTNQAEYRKFPMLYTTNIHTDWMTWEDTNSTRIVLNGSIARSDNPWFNTDETPYWPAFDYHYPDLQHTIRVDFVNIMLYVIGDDGRYYYLTMTELSNGTFLEQWDIRTSAINLNTMTFDEQKKYLIRVPLDGEADDPKQGTFKNIRNEVDYGWRFTKNVSGYMYSLPPQITTGKIYVVPMGDFNVKQDTGGYIWWKDLEINIVTRKDDNENPMVEDSNVVYSQVINDDYLEKNEIELTINTQQSNYPLSYSSLLSNFDDRKMQVYTKLYYNDSATDYDIEEILGNKYYAYYSQPRVILNIPIQGGQLVPFSILHENNVNKDFKVDSYEYDVKLDFNTVNFIEIPDAVTLTNVFEKYDKAKK